MSSESTPSHHGPTDGPVGFEFPVDPDSELPVPSQAHATLRPIGDGQTFPRHQPLPRPMTPLAADGVALAPAGSTPTVPQPVRMPPPPPPSPTFQAPVPTTAAAPTAPESVDDLIGIVPGTGTPPPPPSGPAAQPYAPPATHRAPAAVPVADPRGALGASLDAQSLFTPTTPLAEVTNDRPDIERLLCGLVLNGGSDMHITHGEVPRWRVAGALQPIAGEDVLTTPEIERLLSAIIPDQDWQSFKRTGDLDCAYAMLESEGAALTVRFRINVYRTMDNTGAVMRVIPTKIASLDDLGILPQVKKLATKPRGLILFCGPTGSGKSTSMAGLVDLINSTRDERIFTIEDPVEFTHSSKRCLVSHREVGADTDSFTEGLRRVRREDPDIILIGEMRDYETIGAAIEAADTGHLVIATLHTNSAPETISRIINSFPAERQEQIRVTLSSTLIAVICQTLVPSPTSKRGRVVAQEIMMVTPGIANNIRMNDIPAIANAMTDTSTGSILLDAHLADLIRENKISKKEAAKKASSPETLERYLGNDGDGSKSV